MKKNLKTAFLAIILATSSSSVATAQMLPDPDASEVQAQHHDRGDAVACLGIGMQICYFEDGSIGWQIGFKHGAQ